MKEASNVAEVRIPRPGGGGLAGSVGELLLEVFGRGFRWMEEECWGSAVGDMSAGKNVDRRPAQVLDFLGDGRGRSTGSSADA